MKTTKIGNMSMAYVADDANTLYTLAEGKTIISGEQGLDILGTIKNRDFDIDGTINAGTLGVRIGLAGGFDAKPVDFVIGKSGYVIGGSTGIASYGAGHVIRNDGHVTGGTDGIATHGAETVVNNGEISGGQHGINLFAVADHSAVVKNFGSISGNEYSIYGNGSADKVINKGDLDGDVFLSGGDDTFIYKGGNIDGVVKGDLGHDTYFAYAAGLKIVEDIDKGIDTVKASVDYELQSNIEKLYLIGKGDIDGIGNGGNNDLYGNSGENHLNGSFGFDTLDGGAGDDVVEGGVGSDSFVFHLGTGRDIIADYEATFDDIHFYDLKGADDFADMIANHAKEQNGDVVLTFGKDVIVVQDHMIADLKEADFHFYN